MSVDIVELLANRYSTKMFDSSQTIDREKIEILKETLRLAPSSINSQAWHFFVISNPDYRQKLTEACWDSNKQKMVEASHIFVFAAKTDFTLEDIREVEQLTADVRQQPLNEERLDYLNNYVNSMDSEFKSNWLKRQVYIPVGQLLMSSSMLGLDSCPIEGFLPEQLNELMGLKDQGLTSVAMIALGYRDPEDFNQPEKLAKARFPMEQVITEIA